MLFLLLLQAQSPDIELNVRVRAKEVTVQQKGETSLRVRAEPDSGSRAETNVQPPANGATALRNVTVQVHAEASLADPSKNRTAAETPPPQ